MRITKKELNGRDVTGGLVGFAQGRGFDNDVFLPMATVAELPSEPDEDTIESPAANGGGPA